MKFDAPFDPSFVRTLDGYGAWLYADPSVHSACLAWHMFYKFNLVELDNYLQEDGWDTSEAKKNRSVLIHRRAQALQAQKEGNKGLAESWLNYLSLAMRAGKRMEFLLPLSKTGKKFVSGRKPGSIGPVRQAIRRHLKRQPQANAAQIWAALSVKPPKGMTFYDNRLGKYIESDNHPETQYRQFANLVSFERKLLTPK
jgi:hypothetical protein